MNEIEEAEEKWNRIDFYDCGVKSLDLDRVVIRYSSDSSFSIRLVWRFLLLAMMMMMMIKLWRLKLWRLLESEDSRWVGENSIWTFELNQSIAGFRFLHTNHNQIFHKKIFSAYLCGTINSNFLVVIVEMFSVWTQGRIWVFFSLKNSSSSFYLSFRGILWFPILTRKREKNIQKFRNICFCINLFPSLLHSEMLRKNIFTQEAEKKGFRASTVFEEILHFNSNLKYFHFSFRTHSHSTQNDIFIFTVYNYSFCSAHHDDTNLSPWSSTRDIKIRIPAIFKGKRAGIVLTNPKNVEEDHQGNIKMPLICNLLSKNIRKILVDSQQQQ